MDKRRTVLALLILITSSIYFADLWFKDIHLERLFLTTLSLTVSYFLFEFVIRGKIINRVSEKEGRYHLSKAISFAELIVILVIIGIIWVQDIQSLILSLGIIAAAFTITMQDTAKNFAGGSSIFLMNIYRVGDRIELASKKGDVIDIGLLYTTIMETGEWISGDQHTGRISVIPNSYVLSNTINNYTKDFNFLWDEIILPITYDSDWRVANNLFLEILKKETESVTKAAMEELESLGNKYYVFFMRIKEQEPTIFLKLTDNWIEMKGRYMTASRERNSMRSKITKQILESIEKSGNIRIASQTLDIIDFPEPRTDLNENSQIPERVNELSS